MSNPLLRPNDPRFEKPEVRDLQGKNRFAEEGQLPSETPAGAGVFAASAEEARPFVPKFEVQQQPRPHLLFVLAGAGWAAAIVGAFSLLTSFQVGWISPLIGIVPAGAAWFLAHEELKAIRAGAISEQAREKSQHAFWFGLTALVTCGAVVAAMIYRGLHFLPEI